MKYGSLFSGYGGLDLAIEAEFGATCAWHCEVDPHASAVLAHHWPHVPNLGDVEAVDWSSVEPVDIIGGGSPCQDLSTAGKRQGMMPGTRSGLWAAMCRAIEVIQPELVIWENVSGAYTAEAHSDLGPDQRCLENLGDTVVLRALGRVLGDLAEMGHDARWGSFRASDVGAPHRRERVFLVGRRQAHSVAVAVDFRRQGAESEPRGNHSRSDQGSDAETEGLGWEWGGSPRPRGDGPQDDGGTPTNPTPTERRAAEQQPVGPPPGSTAELGECGGAFDWGPFAGAVRRWELIFGREAPSPVDAEGRLNAWFVEWMMGLPEGHVAAHVTRNPALRMLGNGVVPQQAQFAIRHLMGVKP